MELLIICNSLFACRAGFFSFPFSDCLFYDARHGAPSLGALLLWLVFWVFLQSTHSLVMFDLCRVLLLLFLERSTTFFFLQLIQLSQTHTYKQAHTFCPTGFSAGLVCVDESSVYLSGVRTFTSSADPRHQKKQQEHHHHQQQQSLLHYNLRLFALGRLSEGRSSSDSQPAHSLDLRPHC